VGWYSGDEGHCSTGDSLQSSKRISSPTVLRGEFPRCGVVIGTLRKGGDRVHGGIGVRDGNIDDKFSVPEHGDLRPKMDRVLANCILSVKEGGLGFSSMVDS